MRIQTLSVRLSDGRRFLLAAFAFAALAVIGCARATAAT
jgi:hypothetical protein